MKILRYLKAENKVKKFTYINKGEYIILMFESYVFSRPGFIIYSCGGEYFTISIPMPFGSEIAKCLSPQGSSRKSTFISIP